MTKKGSIIQIHLLPKNLDLSIRIMGRMQKYLQRLVLFWHISKMKRKLGG